jgi:serine/threonine protein kinase/formylglycine-generating enzyme required for sulfatase activity
MWTPPRHFDDYELVRLLGQGGMGQVFLARDVLLDRYVALKFISTEFSDNARQRFIVEARAFARLQHPNVVSIFRVGEVQGRPYLVSEFIRGEGLDRVPRPVPWREALRIGEGIARALAAAHRRGVLHRDIKPANVILSEEGEVKLLDFGLAKLLDPSEVVRMADSVSAPGQPAPAPPDGPTVERPVEARGDDDIPLAEVVRTPVGALLGTPGYIAPEVWLGEPATFRSDVYSLGAVLYALCSGHSPHHTGENATIGVRTIAEDARPLAEVAPDVDRAFAAVVDRCLRRSSVERYASGNEVRAALARLTADVRAEIIPAGNPYRGLHPFEAQHFALYFGRDSEIRTILDRLSVEPFVLVAGDSGVGKSSVCRAGVLPRIAEGLDRRRAWTLVSLVPGRHPLASFAAALAPVLEQGEEDVRVAICAGPGDVVRRLRSRQGRDAGVVVFIDQLEELATLGEPEEVAVVTDLVGWMVEGGPSLKVLATVRADFLGRVAAMGAIADAVSRALYFLRPLSGERIREAIVAPARAKGVCFESEAMVDELVQSTARAGGGLPLLQFALAELWEVCDARGVISAASLAALGGVAGALSRHGDSLLAGMPPAERAAARGILLRLVSSAGTRVRRTAEELTSANPSAKVALETLVRGRVVVARETVEGSGYEIAHEALVRGWPTLGAWLANEAQDQALRERLASAAAEWERLGRTRETLWRGRQLKELADVDWTGLSERERRFLAASATAVRQGRVLVAAAVLAIPVMLAITYVSVVLRARGDLTRRVDAERTTATQALAEARAKRLYAVSLERKAVALFEEPSMDAGEAAWKEVRAAQSAMNAAFAGAARAAEAALALEPSRPDVRGILADVLLERAVVADAQHLDAERDELLQRLALYDDGTRRARWEAPARVSFGSDPAVTMTLERFVRDAQGVRVPEPLRELAGPLVSAPLPGGSYRMTLHAPGCAATIYPFSVQRDEVARFDVQLVPLASVPAGFVYVPAGRFLFGTQAEDSMRRGFFHTVPIHEASTAGYLIASHECTFAEWIDYLRTLPPRERPGRYPAVQGGFEGALVFRQLPGEQWELTFRPASQASQSYTVRSGERLTYPDRTQRKSVDWMALPVVGVSADDAEAYAAWLDRSGRVPRARLCTEREWERAARGADDRLFPHGDSLAPDDADFDQTYARAPRAMGPDEVGSHPASRSPFGLDDMAGNVWEWTRSSLGGGAHAARGGSFYFDVNAARVSEREVPEPSFRDVSVGFRVCADLPPHAETAGRADSAR